MIRQRSIFHQFLQTQTIVEKGPKGYRVYRPIDSEAILERAATYPEGPGTQRAGLRRAKEMKNTMGARARKYGVRAGKVPHA